MNRSGAAVVSNCVVIGMGRAGGSFAGALSAAGWHVTHLAGRAITAEADATDDQLATMLAAADLVLIAVADAAISPVARALPTSRAVYAHVSGAAGLDVLAPHRSVGSLHPLMSLPNATVGARRLLDGCTFAVDGDPLMQRVVDSLGGRAVAVSPDDRARYHAAATIAANHLTALCAQVEQLAADVGVPVDAYWEMMSHTLGNIAEHGAAAALTGPASRGDWATLRTHLDAMGTDHDRELYRAGARAAARLAGRTLPADLVGRSAPD